MILYTCLMHHLALTIISLHKNKNRIALKLLLDALLFVNDCNLKLLKNVLETICYMHRNAHATFRNATTTKSRFIDHKKKIRMHRFSIANSIRCFVYCRMKRCKLQSKTKKVIVQYVIASCVCVFVWFRLTARHRNRSNDYHVSMFGIIIIEAPTEFRWRLKF